MELFLQVKDLFLQINHGAGAELGKLHLILRHFELASQHGLANTQPPFLRHLPAFAGIFCSNQEATSPSSAGESVAIKALSEAGSFTRNSLSRMRTRISAAGIWARTSHQFPRRKLRASIIAQCQQTKHRNVVPRRWNSLTAAGF